LACRARTCMSETHYKLGNLDTCNCYRLPGTDLFVPRISAVLSPMQALVVSRVAFAWRSMTWQCWVLCCAMLLWDMCTHSTLESHTLEPSLFNSMTPERPHVQHSHGDIEHCQSITDNQRLRAHKQSALWCEDDVVLWRLLKVAPAKSQTL
jgi:hypothetical protein